MWARRLTLTVFMGGFLASMALVTPGAHGQLKQSKNSQQRSTFEDNGDITKAVPLYETTIMHGPIRVASTIGDGPHGSSGSGSGDYDFWEIPGVNKGWIISVDIIADDLDTGLDPILVVYDGMGNILGSNDDAWFCCDSFVEVTAPAAGTYYVDVHAYWSDGLDVLTDPFDSSTGPGIDTEGDYELTIALHAVHP